MRPRRRAAWVWRQRDYAEPACPRVWTLNDVALAPTRKVYRWIRAISPSGVLASTFSRVSLRSGLAWKSESVVMLRAVASCSESKPKHQSSRLAGAHDRQPPDALPPLNAWGLFDLAAPGIENKPGRRAVLYNGDFVNDPAVCLFEAGGDGFSRTSLFRQSCCRGKVDRSFLQASQFQLVLLVKFGYGRGRAFTYYLSGPGIDSAFPHVIVLIGFYLVGQLTCLTVKTDIDDLRVLVSFRRNVYRLSKTDFRRLEGFYFLLSGNDVRLRCVLCKSRRSNAQDEERKDLCFAHRKPPVAGHSTGAQSWAKSGRAAGEQETQDRLICYQTERRCWQGRDGGRMKQGSSGDDREYQRDYTGHPRDATRGPVLSGIGI